MDYRVNYVTRWAHYSLWEKTLLSLSFSFCFDFVSVLFVFQFFFEIWAGFQGEIARAEGRCKGTGRGMGSECVR